MSVVGWIALEHYLKHNPHQQHWAVKFIHLWRAVVGGAAMNDYLLHNPCADGSTVLGNIGPCHLLQQSSLNGMMGGVWQLQLSG